MNPRVSLSSFLAVVIAYLASPFSSVAGLIGESQSAVNPGRITVGAQVYPAQLVNLKRRGFSVIINNRLLEKRKYNQLIGTFSLKQNLWAWISIIFRYLLFG